MALDPHGLHRPAGSNLRTYEEALADARRAKLRALAKHGHDTFYECGICSQWHSPHWNGDCREDANRFNPEDMDEVFGPTGWFTVDMPGGESHG